MAKTIIYIINGPNLNLVGQREPEVYGRQSLTDFLETLRQNGKADIRLFQSNIEGEIVDYLQQAGCSADGVILNAGGYTHTSVAIADAVAAINTPVVEVHISNIFAREKERHVSLLSKYCVGIISGFGLHVYRLALDYLLQNRKRLA